MGQVYIAYPLYIK